MWLLAKIRDMDWKGIALCFLAVAIAVHTPLYFFELHRTHDGPFHWVNAQLMTENLSLTAPYPRWLPQAMNGHGSPIFFFYSPLFYYVYAAFNALSFGLLPGYTVMGLGLTLMSAFLGLTSYLWAREYLDRVWSLGAALVFMLAPYHFDMNLAIKGAVTEAAAVAWLPLVFLAAKRLASAGNQALWPSALLAALSFAGLLYTHILTAFMIAPFVGIYAVCLAWISQENALSALKRIGITGAAFALGAALAAPLLVPAMTLLGEITPAQLWDHPYMQPENWIPFAWLAWHGLPLFMIGMSALAALAIVLAAQFSLLPFFFRKRFSRECLVWIGLGGMTICLMLAFPPLFWGDGNPLARVQFPYRYIGILEFVVFSIALCVLRDIGARRVVWQRLLAVQGLVLIVGAVGGLVALALWDQSYELEERFVRKRTMLWQAHEYLPRAITGDNDFTLKVVKRIQENDAPFLQIENGQGSARLLNRRGADFLIEVSNPAPATLHVRQFAFPGWHAADTRTGTNLAVTGSGEFNTIAVEVPSGQRRIRVFREPLPAEWHGLIVFLVSGTILIAGSAVHYGWLTRLRALAQPKPLHASAPRPRHAQTKADPGPKPDTSGFNDRLERLTLWQKPRDGDETKRRED